ncbi:hypothetical protein RCO48_03150 [Peribacillus frigoritolerans]|nr:hypothetical protein [Peribacillus frigoritolerans]
MKFCGFTREFCTFTREFRGFTREFHAFYENERNLFFIDIDYQSGFISGSTLFLSITSMGFILFISPLRMTTTLLL